MIDLSIVGQKVRNLFHIIDPVKSVAEMGEVSDGFFLSANAKDEKYCSFHIEITPHVFDISAGIGFMESDVSHDNFSFEEIIHSIIVGRVKTVKRKIFSFIPRVVLDVDLFDNGNFYMVRNGIGPDRRGVGLVYQTYLIPDPPQI